MELIVAYFIISKNKNTPLNMKELSLYKTVVFFLYNTTVIQERINLTNPKLLLSLA